MICHFVLTMPLKYSFIQTKTNTTTTTTTIFTSDKKALPSEAIKPIADRVILHYRGENHRFYFRFRFSELEITDCSFDFTTLN